MISIRKILNIIVVIFLITIMVTPLLGVLYIFFNDKGACLETGGVWDEEEGRCRQDCLVWNKKFGCIELTAEQVKKMESCRSINKHCLSIDDFFVICQNNNKAWNLDNKSCRFEFEISECGKLSGHWQYPSLCKE